MAPLRALAQTARDLLRRLRPSYRGKMRLLRVFAKQSLTPNWLERSPPLPLLLQCFEVNRQKPSPDPVSVFRVGSETEEAEAVAAVFLKTRESPVKRYGIIVTDEDCREAGITLDLQERGDTGILAVDGRHVNLRGETVDQFGLLMAQIVQAMWEGEQRLRFYPAQQIAGQIAVFSKLPDNQIDPSTRQTCRDVLAQCSNWHAFEDTARLVMINGSLKDKGEFPVIAQRAF
jgi:hypothetical protein